MLVIGNIVTSETKKVEIPRINVVSDISEIDNEYPTLLVGYYNTKQHYKLDFLNRRLEDDLFWTFTRSEERTMYNRDLYDFIMFCEERLLSNFNYYHIDPFNIKKKSLKKIIKHIKSNETKYIVDNDMLFIHTKGVTFGFNMAIGEVIGISKPKLLNKIMNSNMIKLPEERVDNIYQQLGEIEFDIGQILYLSEKIQD